MSRKKRRTGGEDRISELSDDVLCYILSFLTTKEAIATSLLSTRWTRPCRMLPSLHLHCSKPIIQHHAHVHTFLDLHTAQEITAFHLRCDTHEPCCSHYVHEWVSGVVAKKVQNINISICMSHATTMLSFPALFSSSTIVTFSIRGPFDLSIPSSIHLPNLKTMHLSVNSCNPISNICSLVSQSPALELFSMRPKFLNHGLEEMTLVLNSRHIQLFYHNWLCDLFIESDRDYDFISDVMAIRTWPNIVKVKVYVTVHFEAKDFLIRILRGVRNVERLYMKYFRHRMKPFLYLLPFNNLVELHLVLKRNDPLFEHFPSKCPKLQVLEFNIMDDLYGISERYRYNVSDGVRQRDLSIVHVQPQTLPL